MAIDYDKQPYDLYRRWRMFKTGKKLFMVERGLRRTYCLSPTLEHCLIKYTNSSTLKDKFAFTQISGIYVFFVDIFNLKAQVKISNIGYYRSLSNKQKRYYIRKLKGVI